MNVEPTGSSKKYPCMLPRKVKANSSFAQGLRVFLYGNKLGSVDKWFKSSPPHGEVAGSIPVRTI